MSALEFFIARGNLIASSGSLTLNRQISSLQIGLGFCIASALGYTLSNALLRSLSTNADHLLTICVKETITVLIVGPVLLALTLCGRFNWPGWRCIGILVFAGFVTQLGGNVPVLWSFSVIGMSVAVPIFIGMNLVGSAILGRIVLKEPVCVRTMCAIGLLVVSVVLLNLGDSNAPDLKKTSWEMQLLGTGASILGGFCFAVMTVSIRYALLTGESSLASKFWTVVLMIPAAGTYILGPILLLRWFWGSFPPVSIEHGTQMLAAGLVNFISFFLLSKGLRMVPVVLVNITNTTQVAMGALLGIFLFHETLSTWLIAGLLTAMVGVILIGSKGRRRTA